MGEVLPLVYDELRRLARSHLRRENPGHTLCATGLAHEVNQPLTAIVSNPPAVLI